MLRILSSGLYVDSVVKGGRYCGPMALVVLTISTLRDLSQTFLRDPAFDYSVKCLLLNVYWTFTMVKNSTWSVTSETRECDGAQGYKRRRCR